MTVSRPDATPPAPPAATTGQAADGRSHQTAAPRTRLVVASALAGLVLGALCGAVLGGLRPPVVTATAYVAVRPDPLVATGGTGQLSDAQTANFLEAERIYLNSPAFAELVQERVGAVPVVTATRQQDSDVMQLLVEAASAEDAVATTDAATDLYRERRTAQVVERLDAQVATVDAQLEQAREALDALPPVTSGAATSASVQREAAAARYTSLLTIRDELVVARGASETVVRVMQPGYAEPTAGLSPTVAGALGGGALGVLLTVGTVVVARRFSRRIGGPEDLTRYPVPVLSPEVPHRRVKASSLSSPAVEAVVATHAPRLASGRDHHPGLVLVGPTTGVGASYLALQHALHAARRGPTLLVRVSGADDAVVAGALGIDPVQARLDLLPDGRVTGAALTPMVQATSEPGLWVLSADADDDAGLGAFERALEHGLVEAALDTDLQVVVDAPPLDRSTAALVAARRCGSTVLVVASGHTERQEVERALDTFASWGLSLTGVVTNRAPRAAAGAARPARSGSSGAGSSRSRGATISLPEPGEPHRTAEPYGPRAGSGATLP